MNVLILHSSSDLYGASKILLIVIQNLINNGFEPTIVLSENGPLVQEIENMGVEVHIIRLGILRRKYFSPKGIINRINVISSSWKKLQPIIHQKKIQTIYSNTTGVLIGAFLARKYKLNHIWHVHEIINDPLLFVKFIGYLLNAYSTKVIVVSESVKNCWQKYVSNEKLIRIYNGIDYSFYIDRPITIKHELNIPEDFLVIGMIGRVHYWKGQDYFLKIAGELCRNNKNLCFVMAGDAFPGYEYLYKKLDDIIKEEKLTEKVYNLGYRTDIANILNSVDIFILPSTLPDPFPTVLLEAMATAKPVAATSHGGSTEMIVDGESGMLIPFDDAIKAAEKIQEIVADKSKREEMGLNARIRVVNNFSLEAFNTAIINLFK